MGKEFETVHKHQKEWKACVMFSQHLSGAFGDFYKLADYNVSSVLNGLGKNIVKTDMEHPVDERNLLVSTCKSELQRFFVNKPRENASYLLTMDKPFGNVAFAG